jgi:hypothetical protein
MDVFPLGMGLEMEHSAETRYGLPMRLTDGPGLISASRRKFGQVSCLVFFTTFRFFSMGFLSGTLGGQLTSSTSVCQVSHLELYEIEN